MQWFCIDAETLQTPKMFKTAAEAYGLYGVYHRLTNQSVSVYKNTGKTCIHQQGKFILMTMFGESLIEILVFVCLFITHYIY